MISSSVLLSISVIPSLFVLPVGTYSEITALVLYSASLAVGSAIIASNSSISIGWFVVQFSINQIKVWVPSELFVICGSPYVP